MGPLMFILLNLAIGIFAYWFGVSSTDKKWLDNVWRTDYVNHGGKRYKVVEFIETIATSKKHNVGDMFTTDESRVSPRKDVDAEHH